MRIKVGRIVARSRVGEAYALVGWAVLDTSFEERQKAREGVAIISDLISPFLVGAYGNHCQFCEK